MGRERRERASWLRQELVGVQARIGEELDRLLDCRAVLKGSLYEWRRRCGARNCRCCRGELHSSWIWSSRQGGQVRRVTVSAGELRECATAVEAYRAFRMQRRQVVKDQARMQALLKELEQALSMEAPRRQAEGL